MVNEIMPPTKAFLKVFKNVKKTYLGEEVPMPYRKSYGKIYNKKDLMPLAIKIAKSRGIPVDKELKGVKNYGK